MEDVQWGPPLLVLAVGVALGLLVVWRVRAGTAPAAVAPPDLERRDLEARRDALLRQLAELDATAVKRDPGQLARERYALELDAAEVWRRLDQRAAEAPAPAPAPAGATPAATPAPAASPGSALTGFLWGIGSAAAIGLLMFAVSRDAAPREEGGSVTGTVPGQESPRGAAGPSAGDPDVAALQARVEGNPEDLEGRLALAQALLVRQDLMGVFEQTQFVLERRPDDPRALSYQSLVRLAMGQPDMALQMLQRALELEPDYLEGYVHLALVQTQTGDIEAATATIGEASRRHPSQAAMLEELLGEMRRAVASSSVPEGTHPDVAPPPAAGSGRPPAAAAAAGGPGFAGELRLDPAEGPLPPGAVLFIYVREAGYTSGAPNAVKRLPATSLPLRFRITAADSMMGGELPEVARIEARIDRDGDVSTRDPRDPLAALDDVPIGREDLELVLRAQ